MLYMRGLLFYKHRVPSLRFHKQHKKQDVLMLYVVVGTGAF